VEVPRDDIPGMESKPSAENPEVSSKQLRPSKSGSQKNRLTADSGSAQIGMCEETKENKKRKAFQDSRNILESGGSDFQKRE